ncbi:MAG: hypothetical protein Q9M18_08830, partial [Mariprofundaceae bacterium]|nr:hypothetical protein [Mariprofundaceae bacterium]
MNYTQLKRYFMDGVTSYIGDLIPSQIQQAWIRLCSFFLIFIYIAIHADDLLAHYTALAVFSISYIGLQVYTLINVKKNPLSFPRTIISPIFDVSFLSLALLFDGGQFSPLYLFYLVTIMGVGMRFGNHFLLYTQTLSLIAFPSTCFYLLMVHHLPIDIPVLIIQML